MKVVFEEYGEVILAIAGSVGVIGLSLALLWGTVGEQVLYIAQGM